MLNLHLLACFMFLLIISWSSTLLAHTFSTWLSLWRIPLCSTTLMTRCINYSMWSLICLLNHVHWATTMTGVSLRRVALDLRSVSLRRISHGWLLHWDHSWWVHTWSHHWRRDTCLGIVHWWGLLAVAWGRHAAHRRWHHGGNSHWLLTRWWVVALRGTRWWVVAWGTSGGWITLHYRY